jgi:outer membrane protein, adhesin transport system
MGKNWGGVIAACLICLASSAANAQRSVIATASDALPSDGAGAALDPVLQRLLNDATRQHPTVAVERLQKAASEEDLEAAKLQRYPNFTYQTETSGHRPGNSMAMQMPLWNFGRTDAQIDAAKAGVDTQDAKVREIQQALALRVIDAWNTVNLAHEKLRIQQVTRSKLESFTAMMQRRIDAQVSPPIEAELVGARLRQIEADESASSTMLAIHLARLSQLVGATVKVEDLISMESRKANQLLLGTPALFNSLILNTVPDHHPSIQRARMTAVVAAREAQVKDAARYPEVYFKWFRSTGNTGQASHGGMIGLRAESGAGFSSASVAKSAQVRAQALETSVEAVRRDIQEQMDAERENLKNAVGRTQRMSSAVMSAAQVVDSYERLFVAGRRTWQEVLNAVREYNDYQVSHAESRADTLLNIWRLRVRGAATFEGDFLAN